MKKRVTAFIVGLITGTIMGAFVHEDDKRKIFSIMQRQVERLRGDHRRLLLVGIEKMKRFIKAYLR